MTTIHLGDALSVLRTLPDGSVQCVVTSPTYFNLRDYDVAGQLGLEARPDCLGWATGAPCGECYVCRMLGVFREVRRVLRRDGTLFLNMGDSYATHGGDRVGHLGRSGLQGGLATHEAGAMARRISGAGLKAKDLIGMPWRLALAMQADGWWLRSDVVWHKPNPMPSSVKDRPTVSHEYVFLLTKSGRYHYDHEAVKVLTAGPADAPRNRWDTKTHLIPGQKPQKRKSRHKVPGGWDTGPGAHGAFHREGRGDPEYRETPDASTRSMRSVWTIPTCPFPEAHFATFPPALARTCILAGCPVGGTVLDPFCGSGTTGLVARQLGREFVGIELNPKYIRMAVDRIERETGLLGPVRVVAEKQVVTAS
jgi:DNA modification methylase